ncbi:DUF3311 domain-containing protein [Saccharopolyspora sp. NPDC002376]
MGDASGPSQAKTARALRIVLSGMLILVPVALALAVPLYQRTSPTLIGIPFFYWFQMAMAVLAAMGTSTVFRLLFTGDDDGEDRA